MSARAPIAKVLSASLAFGLLAAWAKGTGGGHGLPELRNVLGNLSTPWLLVAFVAGLYARRLRSGALLGLAATMVALNANHGYLEGGIVTGPAFGALGAWWRQRRRWRASLVAGVLLMAEPLVLIVLGSAGPGHVLSPGGGVPLVVRLVPGWGLTSTSDTTAIAVYTAEFALGACLLVLARRRRAQP